MAAITDKITKTMDGQNPNTTFVSNERNQGSTELQARNLDGWPEATAVHFTTYRVDAQGDVVEGTQTDWKGIVNRRTNTIVNLVAVDGSVDKGNSTGDVIEAMPTAAWANDLADALLSIHTTEGSLKDGVVPYAALNPSTEYTEQSSVTDFNDAKFLRPGKWSFRDKANVAKSTNRPCDNAGWLVTTVLNPSLIPGTQANGSIIQTYTDDTGVVYSRNIKSSQSTTATYGKWGATIPMFSATTTAWDVLPRSVFALVKYNKVTYDTANMYNKNTFKATVPVTGIYHIDARVSIASTGFFSSHTAYMVLYKNDNPFKESDRTRGTDNGLHRPQPSLHMDVLLKKGDVIDVRAFCDDQRNYGGEELNSEFNMRLVAAMEV